MLPLRYFWSQKRVFEKFEAQIDHLQPFLPRFYPAAD